jgi:hypothetical protein
MVMGSPRWRTMPSLMSDGRVTLASTVRAEMASNVDREKALNVVMEN